MGLLSHIHSKDKETRKRWGLITSLVFGFLFFTIWMRFFEVWTGSLVMFGQPRKEESTFSFWQSAKETASLLWSSDKNQDK